MLEYSVLLKCGAVKERLYAAHTAAVNFIPENFIFDIWPKLFPPTTELLFQQYFAVFKKIIESVIRTQFSNQSERYFTKPSSLILQYVSASILDSTWNFNF